MENILENELLLIQKMNFHLVIHSPYRPMEGLLIDMKTMYPLLENPESLRRAAEDFLTRASMTDAGHLFPPTQIALATILDSDTYVTEYLALRDDRQTLSKLMRQMTTLMEKPDLPKSEEVNALKIKLERIHASQTTTLLKNYA